MRSPSKDGYLMVPGSRQRGSSLPEPREREEEGAGNKDNKTDTGYWGSGDYIEVYRDR